MKFFRWRKVKKQKGADYFLVACVTFLIIFGLVMLASASSNLGKTQFGDTYYYLKHQFLYGIIPGIILFILGASVYYGRLAPLALWLLFLGMVLLVLVFTPLGIHTKGATRWLTLGPISFHPSEIVKPLFIIYLASWLSRRTERRESVTRGLLPFLAMLGVVTILLLKQPSTSTVAILITTACIVYFLSGARLKFVAGTLGVAGIALLLTVYFTPYRFERIQTFLSPNVDTRTTGYHITQARIAIGSGRLTGVGYGQSTTKVKFLPEPAGDSIFAVIAEELGFIGAAGLVSVFFVFVLKIFLLARRCRDKFGELLLIGFGSLIAIQAILHIGAISGLLPLTGTPLPFISYGGTALAIFMGMSGIIVNISKYV